ncbi:MAG: hypothetical protein ACI9S9_001636 [Planctomycetota bacterium]|jgi:hypothetical protein
MNHLFLAGFVATAVSSLSAGETVGPCRATNAIVDCFAPQSGGGWVALPLSPRPFARERHAMAYDQARSETVMFGGFNGAYLNDTWVLTTTGWVQRSPAIAPAARANHVMTYDPARQRIVLIGGSNGSDFSDIWEWDGASWSPQVTGVAGVAGNGGAAFDPLLGGVLYSSGTTNLLWNGVTMQPLTVSQPSGGGAPSVFSAAAGGIIHQDGPITRRFTFPQGWQTLGASTIFGTFRQALASDPVRNRMFQQGGDGGIGSSSGSGVGYSWQWNGFFWSQVAGPIPRLSRHAMVFDFARDTFVMFGGYANGGQLSDATYTWFDVDPPGAYEAFGFGCSGAAAAVPRLRANPLFSTTPSIGTAFFVLIDQLEPVTPVFGVIGYSGTSWNGMTLPLPLAAFGMPGCDVLVAPEVVESLGSSSAFGEASWPLLIPPNPSLVGAEFYQQALVFAPFANPAGIIWSNGGHGRIGS